MSYYRAHLGIFAAVVLFASHALAAPSFEMIDLGTLGATAGNFSAAYATDINENGDIVGFSISSDDGNATRAFLWQAGATDGFNGGPMKSLGVLGGGHSDAFGLNDLGQIVGRSSDASGVSVAFIYTEATGMQLVGQLDPINTKFDPNGTFAFDINNDGRIVGRGITDQNTGDQTRAWYKDPGGAITEFPLRTGNGLETGEAYSVNESGSAFGTSFFFDNRAMVWTPSSATTLGTLGGSTSLGRAINDFGVAVGYSGTSGGASDRWAMFSGGSVIDLGVAVHHGVNPGRDMDINNFNQAVNDTGFWADGAFYNLASLITVNTTVLSPAEAGGFAINDKGQIVGYAGITGSTGVHGMLLNPLPGSFQQVPLLPDTVTTNHFNFDDVQSGQWFDPPFVDTFDFSIDGGSLFTLAKLPLGFNSDFEVVVNGGSLGLFSGGAEVDFVTLLGNGVSSFTVQGIDPLVDAEDQLGFPIYLEFDTPTAGFTMTAVPEPATAALFTLATVLLTSRRR